MEKTFALLLILGIGSLIAGVFRARSNWRDDVAPYSRRTRTLELLLHPERYVKVEAVRAVRVWNGVGVLMLAGAVAVLLHEALSP